MGTFFLYLIQSTIVLSLFYCIYKCLLAKETFFAFNRRLLRGGIFIALLLPAFASFIHLEVTPPEPLQKPISYLQDWAYSAEITSSITDVGVAEPLAANEIVVSDEQVSAIQIPWFMLLTVTFTIGFAINLALLLISFWKMRRLIRKGKKLHRDDYTLVVLDEDVSAFSWAKYIVISRSDLQNNGEEIVAHELAHISHRHMIDILFAEFVLLFHWFNPLVWKLKNELKDIHEYQVDKEVINSGINATKYQLLLVEKAVGSSSYALANSFNHSKIKKRITMMLKQKSKKSNRLKSLLLIPIAMLSVYAFACTSEKPNTESKDTLSVEDVQEEKEFVFPLKEETIKRMAAGYGMRTEPVSGTKKLHNGIDLAASKGDTIYAAFAGEVISLDTKQGYGETIVLQHVNNVTTLYAHCDVFLAVVNQRVKAGDPIALVGNTGKSSTYHLHFEMRKDDIPFNPFSIMEAGSDKLKIPLDSIKNTVRFVPPVVKPNTKKEGEKGSKETVRFVPPVVKPDTKEEGEKGSKETVRFVPPVVKPDTKKEGGKGSKETVRFVPPVVKPDTK